MRFLADESCDIAVVRALRKAGHDVLAVAELSPRAEDSDVLDLALKGKRVLLTDIVRGSERKAVFRDDADREFYLGGALPREVRLWTVWETVGAALKGWPWKLRPT